MAAAIPQQRNVSIHAPAWGATRLPRHRRPRPGFNPRPRMGGDAAFDPARIREVFQSTPPHGGRQQELDDMMSRYGFQSTPPHWGRRYSESGCGATRCFNPRPRMGGDLVVVHVHDLRHVSIHAPAWRATQRGVCLADSLLVSIHAPAWRATLWRGWRLIWRRFQSTPPHGGATLRKILV